jgi:hypothetical protein
LEQGKPFSPAGFTNWFRDRCNEAGLPGLSAHGLRKAASTRAAEQRDGPISSWRYFGWRTIKQAEAYTRAAERKRLASGAMHLLGTKSVEMFPTLVCVRGSGAKERAKKVSKINVITWWWCPGPNLGVVPRRGLSLTLSEAQHL